MNKAAVKATHSNVMICIMMMRRMRMQRPHERAHELNPHSSTRVLRVKRMLRSSKNVDKQIIVVKAAVMYGWAYEKELEIKYIN